MGVSWGIPVVCISITILLQRAGLPARIEMGHLGKQIQGVRGIE